MDDALAQSRVIALVFVERLNDISYSLKTELVVRMPLGFRSRIDSIRPYRIDDVIEITSEIRIAVLCGISGVERVIVVEIG